MTVEEMEAMIRKLVEEQQEAFMTKLYADVVNLCDKANDRRYVPTDRERKTFDKIRQLLNNINEWF